MRLSFQHKSSQNKSELSGFIKTTKFPMKLLSVTTMVAVLGFGFICNNQVAVAAGDAPKPPHQSWPFSGVLGQYDKAALQRGYQVYEQVCSSCHSMDYLYYRDLEKIGYSQDDVKAIAAQFEIKDGPDDEGEYFDRPAKPSDRFKAPFDNAEQAKSLNNGKEPPDFSLIAAARVGGADYIYGILTGYKAPPADLEIPEGVYYNEYYPGHKIAMVPPLAADGQVEYADGTPSTVHQMSRDVAQFLQWASDPHLETRKRTGLAICVFLIVLAGVMYRVKKRIWSDLH